MIKKWLCLFALLLISNALFALSPPRMLIAIKNSSSNDVIINMEFWYGPGSNLIPNIVFPEDMWYQTISGIPLTIGVSLTVLRTQIIQPGQDINIISYTGSLGQFNEMVSIPFMVVMNAIFENLKIIYNEGEGVITLENLEEYKIEKHVFTGAGVYLLEIFDHGVERRPSE